MGCKCIIVVLFSSMLVTIIGLMWFVHLQYAVGNVTLTVTRMVSVSGKGYPDLQLEIEVKNKTQVSRIYKSSHEAVMYQEFHFSDVGWNDAMIFRITRNGTECAFLIMSPSEALLSVPSIYEMVPKNSRLVMTVKWKEEEEEETA